MKVSLSYSELRKLFAPVLPHAGTDDMLPVLTRIAVASSGPYLVAQATDRFTAAFQRVWLASAPPAGFGVLLEASDAKRLVHLLRPIRGTDPLIEISVDDNGAVRVASESPGLALGFEGINLRFSSPVLGENAFPDMASLIPEVGDDYEAVAEAVFDITLLSRFKAATDAANLGKVGNKRIGCQILMPSQPTKPLTVAVGADFIGMLMPRNRSAGMETVASRLHGWLNTVPRNGIRPPSGGPAPLIPAPKTPEEIAKFAGLSTQTDAEIDAAAGGQR